MTTEKNPLKHVLLISADAVRPLFPLVMQAAKLGSIYLAAGDRGRSARVQGRVQGRSEVRRMTKIPGVVLGIIEQAGLHVAAATPRKRTLLLHLAPSTGGPGGTIALPMGSFHEGKRSLANLRAEVKRIAVSCASPLVGAD